MSIATKPKAKETGAQVAAAGAVSAILANVLPHVLEVAEEAEQAFEAGGWSGIAAIAIGLTYRAYCKWLDSRGTPLDADAADRIADSAEQLYTDLEPVVHRVYPRRAVTSDADALASQRAVDDEINRQVAAHLPADSPQPIAPSPAAAPPALAGTPQPAEAPNDSDDVNIG